MHLVCPVCGKPENLDDEAVATEYFNNFDIMVSWTMKYNKLVENKNK